MRKPPKMARNRHMRALSVRQTFAELILRGIKTVEYRTLPTRVIGERFWIYASKRPAFSSQLSTGKFLLRDLTTPDWRELPRWMIELAEQIKTIPPDAILPRGYI